MPMTDVVTVSKASKKSGNTDRRYPVTMLTVPAQYAVEIPDKQKYRCIPVEDSFVFQPIKEDS